MIFLESFFNNTKKFTMSDICWYQISPSFEKIFKADPLNALLPEEYMQSYQ